MLHGIPGHKLTRVRNGDFVTSLNGRCEKDRVITEMLLLPGWHFFRIPSMVSGRTDDDWLPLSYQYYGSPAYPHACSSYGISVTGFAG